MTELQKFIEKNADWIDKLRKDPYNLLIQGRDNLVLFKYVQFNSDFSIPLVRECRGIILEQNTWKVICRPFDKFFNFGEKEAFPIKFSNSYVMEKVDGCLDENTVLITKEGEKTIRWICENKYKGKVLCYDIEKKEEVWDTIIDYSIQENNGDWYEIELENGDIIKLTGNHRVWIPELNCYRRVDELKGDEDFLLKK